MAREVLTPIQVYQQINSVYKGHKGSNIPAPNAIIAVFVVLKESGGDTGITNINNDGSVDRGLWQWNNRAWPNITDTIAFDKVASTEAAYTVTSGFAVTPAAWDPWIIGHGSIESEINRTQRNQQAHQTAQTTVSTQGGNTAGSGGIDTTGWTDAEKALVASWDSDGDGKVEKEDITDADETAAETLETDDRIAIADAIRKYKDGKKLKTGWLAAANAAAATAGVPQGTALSAQIKLNAINMMTTGGGIAGIFVDIGMMFQGVSSLPGEVFEGVTEALVPDWMESLGALLRTLMSADFWKRIGIAALGLGVIVAAIIFYNKDTAKQLVSAGTGKAVGAVKQVRAAAKEAKAAAQEEGESE